MLPDQVNLIEKSDTLPNDPYAPPDGSLYRNGPWTLVENEVISQVISGGSPTVQWIPTRGVNTQYAIVQHLSWVAPEGVTGETSYGDYLAGLDPVAECDFGDVPFTWQTCAYAQESNRIVANSGEITQKGLNYKEYENSPKYVLRGPNAGLQVTNDYAWALSVAAYGLEQHLNWNVWYGNPTAFQNTSYGLSSVITTGFVEARKRGSGACDYTNPWIYSGLGKDVKQIIDLARAGFRKIYYNALDRGYRLQQRDVAFFMSRAHWNVIADYLSWNTTYDLGQERTRLVASVRDIDARRATLTTPVPGVPESSGYIPLPEMNVPVIVDDQLGRNVTFGTPAKPGVLGDIYMLTRSFAGMPVLEHHYLNYDELYRIQNYVPNRDRFTQQRGMLQIVYLEKNRICFSMGMEMENRIVTRMQTLQMRINNVIFPTTIESEIESGSYTHPDYYPFEGQESGAGNVLITGLK